jgi:hypothetical protein
MLNEFPEDKNKRRFRTEWYMEWHWLEYSVLKNAAYCFCCRMFTPADKRNSKDTFTIKGFSCWANGSKRFKKHEQSSMHVANMASWIERKNKTQVSIASKLVCVAEAEKLKNRRNFTVLAEATLFLAKQGLAFRGHREKINVLDPLNPNTNSKNAGNFLELVKLLCGHLPELKEHTANKNCNYTSKESQNQILSLMASQLRQRYLSEIKDKSVYYAIMIDETMDLSKKEQVSFCVRYVDNDSYAVNEVFLGFFDTPSTTSEHLFGLVQTLIKSYGLDINHLVGQAYDGAAVFSYLNYKPINFSTIK